MTSPNRVLLMYPYGYFHRPVRIHATEMARARTQSVRASPVGLKTIALLAYAKQSALETVFGMNFRENVLVIMAGKVHGVTSKKKSARNASTVSASMESAFAMKAMMVLLASN